MDTIIFKSLDLKLTLKNYFHSIFNLVLHKSIAFGLLSTPIQFLFNLFAAAKVVPVPQKKSATRSPSFDEANMIRSNNFSGF